jgi:hypothetical protein
MNRYVALLICFFTGSVGLHFVYMGRFSEACIRAIWLFGFWPVACVGWCLDLSMLLRMNKYQFDSYCRKRVKGTGSKEELKKYYEKIQTK